MIRGLRSVPERIAQMNAQAFSLTADGDAEWVTEDVPALLGHSRPGPSGEFAADYATAFSWTPPAPPQLARPATSPASSASPGRDLPHPAT